MKKTLALLLAAISLFCLLSGCAGGGEKDTEGTFLFTDSCERQVRLPESITRIAPSGSVATMMLAIIAPELMVCVAGSPSSSQNKYLPSELVALPTTGQLYGSKSTINFEALIDAGPQVIIDMGDPKDNMAGDLDELQKKTAIPVIFVEADLDSMAEAYRTLGKILGRPERGEELASFIDETMTMAEENSAKLTDADKVSVMLTSGTSGLNTDAEGSVQAQVLDIVGAANAIVVEDVSNKGGGNTIGMEQLYNFDPECIIFGSGGPYDVVNEGGSAWAELSAIKNDMYFEIPGLPYNWMSNPPSVNMILGVWWLGNLVYPDIYDYDMTDKAQEIYKLFWNYDLSDEEATEMLAKSTTKRALMEK